MTDLQGLIERLEKADGPDLETDAALLNATGPISSLCRECWGLGGSAVRGDGRKCTRCGRTDPDPITASLDAAVNFAERVLPGCYWRIEKMTPARAILSPGSAFWATCGRAGEQETAYAKTAPIAILIATLRALDHPTE